MPELVESINCPKCGGPLNLTTGEVIVTCPYCGTASRIRGDKPFVLTHSMLAARMDRDGALRAIQGWMEGGVMKPDDLRRASRITSLECVYLPFYVFEVDGHQRELLSDFVDVIEDARTQVDVKDSEFLHAPIWFSTYEYRTRSYTILLDAASGEVVRGDIPPPSGGFGEFLKGASRDMFRG